MNRPEDREFLFLPHLLLCPTNLGAVRSKAVDNLPEAVVERDNGAGRLLDLRLSMVVLRKIN
jgi:hypothetical protein